MRFTVVYPRRPTHSGAARALSTADFPERSFQPKWAPAPLLKQRERSFPQLGFPRQTDSLCPRCVTEVRTEILAGEADWKVLVDGKPGEIKALDRRGGRPDPDAQGVLEARPLRGRDVDRRAFFKRIESLYPGRDFVDPEGRAPRARHVVDQVRARRRADDRPDQPLQHDVQPVLHGRQPGRVRPRARVGRGEEAPRRRGVDQAAPPALGAVLGRRADPVARTSCPRSGTRAKSATSRCSARRTESVSRRTRGSRRRRRKPASGSPICSSTASETRTTSTARSATCTTSS